MRGGVATGRQRVELREELLRAIRAKAAAIDSSVLAGKLEAAKVPYGIVNDMAAVFEQPRAQRLLLEGCCDDRAVRGVRTLALGGDAVNLVQQTPPPHLNQHADAILNGMLAYDGTAVARLARAGVFGAETSI